MKRLLRLTFISLSLLGVAIVVYFSYPTSVPLNPLYFDPILGEKSKIETRDYQILGFVPFWNLKKLTPESLSSITHFGYFALHLDNDGSLYTHVNRHEQDPGYTNYRRLLANPVSRKPLILTFVPADQESLSSILGSGAYRARAVATIINAVKESGAAGVNIDFEPTGASSPAERDSFTIFIKDLRATLCPSVIDHCPSVSLSLYPSAASRPRLWDIAALEPYLDEFVVMTYDYTLPSDNKTGPNSPLRGAGTLFDHDILTNLSQFIALVPAHKILLGIPFYGYEWSTAETAKYTPATGRGSVASLERINELIAQNTLELLWDRNTLTPYAIRRMEGEVVSQIYYEDEKSIKLKLDLVKQAGLGGIAIWALGYEGSNADLWSVITSSLTSQ